jgi:hypothetical protein
MLIEIKKTDDDISIIEVNNDSNFTDLFIDMMFYIGN